MTQLSSGQHRQNDCALGGATLAIGALGYAVAVVAYVVLYGQPDGTGEAGAVTMPDRVSHHRDRWRVAQILWFVEMLAALLIAAGALVLRDRVSVRSVAWSSLAWTTVGIGAILLALMYPIMLGGYPHAAAAFDTEPALFGVLNGIAAFLFNAGNAIVFAGFAAVFAAEMRAAAVPKAFATAGVALSLLSALVAVGSLIGVVALIAAAPLGLVAFALIAYLGFTIAKRTG